MDSTPRPSLRYRRPPLPPPPLPSSPILRPSSPPPLDALKPLASAGPSPKSLAPLVHLLVVLVVAASIGFGLFVGNHSRSGGKYGAIQFAGEQAVPGGIAVTDSESGDLLGGKRAAIQFYHDRQRQRAAEEASRAG